MLIVFEFNLCNRHPIRNDRVVAAKKCNGLKAIRGGIFAFCSCGRDNET